MPRSRTRVVMFRPGHRCTRASKVSPSTTCSILQFGLCAAGPVVRARPLRRLPDVIRGPAHLRASRSSFAALRYRRRLRDPRHQRSEVDRRFRIVRLHPDAQRRYQRSLRSRARRHSVGRHALARWSLKSGTPGFAACAAIAAHIPASSSMPTRRDGFGLDALVIASRLEFRRVDAAQPHPRGDVESRPQMHAGFERIAVEHAQHFHRHARARAGSKIRLLHWIVGGRGPSPRLAVTGSSMAPAKSPAAMRPANSAAPAACGRQSLPNGHCDDRIFANGGSRRDRPAG